MYRRSNEMVDFIENVTSKVTLFDTVIAGGGAGAITRAIAQPLDVLKIRFQLQLEPISNAHRTSRYTSILQASSAIIKQEGLSTLWSGHVPAQFLSISYGVIQFTTFEALTQLHEAYSPQGFNDYKPFIYFKNGAIAAVLSTVFTFPFDTIRTRLIAEEKTMKVYKGFMNAFSMMVQTEGLASLYKGMLPTMMSMIPLAGIQFSTYKMMTEVMNKVDYFQRDTGVHIMKTTLTANLIAGSVAGFVSKTAIYPLDLAKKRLQIQGFQHHRTKFGRQMYTSGLLDCIRMTVREEGILSLYKGFLPSTLKAIVVSALHFSVYDEIRLMLSKLHKS